jgi:Bax protein
MNSHRSKQCGLGHYCQHILAVAAVFVFAESISLADDVSISSGVPDTAAIRELVGEDDLIVDVTRERVEFCFDSIGYTVEQLLAGRVNNVPRTYLLRIPEGWATGETVQFKKSIFYRVILPLILKTNEEVRADRQRLDSLKLMYDNGTALRENDELWVLSLASQYGVAVSEGWVIMSETFDELSLRVDVVPVSLALGQAAYESGYGTSRFAHQGNSLFGQWTWGGGIKPSSQRAGKGDYGIKQFIYPLESARSYLHNLNTHRAYQDFRVLRAAARARATNKPLNGYELAGALQAYSELGEKYVKTLRNIMRVNKLEIADSASLRDMGNIYFY